jgi:hypothetical protein
MAGRGYPSGSKNLSYLRPGKYSKCQDAHANPGQRARLEKAKQQPREKIGQRNPT